MVVFYILYLPGLPAWLALALTLALVLARCVRRGILRCYFRCGVIRGRCRV